MTDGPVARQIRASFEARLPGMEERARRVQVHPVGPAHWHAQAAAEIARAYVDGHFYASISLAQAYLEALSRHLSEVRHARIARASDENWQRLAKERVITQQAAEAAIAAGHHRNDFHHLNPAVPQQRAELQALAEACLAAVWAVETEVFSCAFCDGAVSPTRPELWPSTGEGLLSVFLRGHPLGIDDVQGP